MKSIMCNFQSQPKAGEGACRLALYTLLRYILGYVECTTQLLVHQTQCSVKVSQRSKVSQKHPFITSALVTNCTL